MIAGEDLAPIKLGSSSKSFVVDHSKAVFYCSFVHFVSEEVFCLMCHFMSFILIPMPG